MLIGKGHRHNERDFVFHHISTIALANTNVPFTMKKEETSAK